MEEKQLREMLLERLHFEMQLFKDSMLCKSREDIYTSSYMIEIYINFYEILADQTGQMKEPLLRKLLYQPSCILDDFYQKWLDKDDGIYTELQDYVKNELNIISASRKYDGKEEEDEYGKEFDQAA